MVINRGEMKRKRREDCSSPLLDESPKRTKVHAQRKFAQGSNVNSPVITPVKEIEKQEIDVLPEPVELLPIKRPNTDDFLTFLCFRGTPILPPSLNFFNTASIVDTNGQVHEIKSESPKNGPIDTSTITKSGSGSAERPFIAFGVRKRADPIVISRQMDKKRRHALALQALRRKYQEQRMAKIRAVTISKLSEKVSNKTLVRSNSISKNETVNKKGNTIQKNKAVETATKHVKVVTRSAKTTLRPQIKQKMCLRSFRGRFVQKELQFRNVKKRPLPVKKVIKSVKKKEAENVKDSEYSSEDEKPLSKTSLETKRTCKVVLPKVAKKMAPGPKKPMEINFRITRSNKFLNNKIVSRRQQIKQRMLMSTPKTTVKPRTLRSHTAQKTKIISETTQKVIVKAKKVGKDIIKKDSTPVVKKLVKSSEQPKNEQKEPVKKYEKDMRSVRKDEKDLKPIKKDEKDLKLLKKDEKVLKPLKKDEKEIKSVKKDEKEMKSVKKFEKDIKCVKKDEKDLKSESSRVPVKSTDAMKKDFSPISSNKNKVEKVPNVKNIDITKKAKLTSKQTVQTVSKKPEPTIEKKDLNKKKVPVAKKEPPKKNENSSKKDFGTSKKEPLEEVNKKTVVVKSTERKENIEFRTSQRPTRKTKEAAAIYMEILSHKLVNESRMDDDNVSIDSFPELPNVKRTEQRENELKAKARSTKTSESETDTKKHPKIESDTKKTPKIKEKEVEVVESKSLRSNDKKLEVRNEEEKKVLEEPKAESVKIEVVKEEVLVCDRKTRSANQEKTVASPLDKIKEVELKVHINPIELNSENKNVVAVKRKKEKLQEDETETDISDNNLKSKKCEKTIKPDVEGTKRQTRNSSQNIRHADSDDSDESFRADIRIPRKKQLTRSKVLQTNESEDDSKSLKKPLNTKSYKECDSSSSDSDQSTTSDINVKPVKVTKNKKFTKTRSQQKSDQGFSDSDEEPLSKLTQSIKTIDTKDTIKEEICSEKKSKVQQPDPKTNKTKDTKEKTVEINEKEAKPKRECAKRPQYYLPMFSSSDEEDNYFQGFTSKPEKPKISKSPENGCSHNKTTLDLSCKDIGRRFGKGKVNMSTEQIEKWLKDSAMAGSSVKNENDEMLKFGEKIPTETSHSVATSIDTEKLKTLLITNIEKIEGDVEKKDVPKSAPSDSVNKLGRVVKPNVTDRKLIFRNKDKAGGAPRVQAFSASNESSVYAFGEDEDVMKTPFRRPTRRPSSTATSRSEDESSKFEDFSKTASTSGQFRKPPLLKQDSSKSLKESLPTDETSEDTVLAASSEDNAFNAPTQPHKPLIVTNKPKSVLSVQKKHLSMVPPTSASPKLTPKHSLKQPPKLFDRSSDASEDLKYKVPSSPSASSSSSAKLYKRQASNKPKLRATEIFPVKLPDFPIGGNSALLVEAPTFHPTDKEFQDPLEYIEKIRAKAEQFGICRIVPPSNFKPECKVTDDMRFTAYNQYVHKMLHRWGPNFKELMAIKKYLSTQNINLTHPPWIGGMEIDLPRLYQTVQTLGGLKEVIEKKKWPKVSDLMKIPKSAQDRVTKLDDIYCKYLLPYDTLSPAEREKLFDEVETEWAKRESKSLLKAQQNIDDNTMEVESESDDEAEECIVKGRSMALNAFYRIARNTMSMWFKNAEPPAEEVEQEFWKHVTLKQNHICVHSGSIDSGNWGYGFAVSKNSPFARHAWNLKVLTNNSGSILRSMGPVMGVTVPTLHVGMVFSSCCWYRDPHSLPWIEYLHTGGNKIWYGIPDSTSGAFHSALKTLVPNYCRNKSLWLPSDTVMVPPNLLVENGVSLCRIVQEPGQFIVVFPKVFTSSLSTGYVVSESVYFAPPYWLKTGRSFFNEMRNSCEPPMFSFDKLLLSIVNDARSNVEVLKLVIPAVQELCDKEKSAREKVKGLGVTETERLPLPEAPKVRKKKMQNEDGEYECEICRMNLFVSMVTESQEDAVYCLDHAVEQIEKKKVQSKHCTLTFTYDDEELDGLVEKIKLAITCKMQKKVPNKFTGLPTLLTK